MIGRLYSELKVNNKYCDQYKSVVSYGQAQFSRS